jgi:glycosyltransferase involved in cell wall biosynthesis
LVATTSNREHPAQQLRGGNLDSCRLGIDVRYLRRQGIGISGYVHQAVRELLEAGADLTLLTDSEEHCGALRSGFPSAAAVALPTRSGFRWEQQRLPRHLAAARYDAYIAPANYGLPLAYRGPTALILVVHDLIPLRLGHIYLLPRPLWATKYLLSVGIAAARADRVAAPSHATARDVARLLRHRDVSVAYPPIPAPYAAEGGAEPAAPPVALPDGLDHAARSYFLYNGGADIRKNVPTLLRAFARIRDELPATDLIMIGPGQEHFHKLIHGLRLEDRVHTLGYVDEAAKESLMRHAVALLYPSRIEGFGLPVLEAMAAGIPVVSGTGGSLAEIGGDAVVYVRPINDESLATAMMAVSQETARETARLAGISQLKQLMGRRQQGTLAGIVAAGIRKASLSIRYLMP